MTAFIFAVMVWTAVTMMVVNADKQIQELDDPCLSYDEIPADFISYGDHIYQRVEDDHGCTKRK